MLRVDTLQIHLKSIFFFKDLFIILILLYNTHYYLYITFKHYNTKSNKQKRVLLHVQKRV